MYINVGFNLWQEEYGQSFDHLPSSRPLPQQWEADEE